MRREQIRKTDFELSELPKTRLEQFFDILKHQTWNLIKVSGLQTVFNMPLIVWFVLFIMAITSVNPEGTFVVILVGGAILVPCLMISNIGLTGSFYCMKKMAYGDGIFAASSFFLGMKEEFKKGLGMGFIYGLVAFGSFVGSVFLYFYSAANPWIIGLGITMLVILFLLMAMINYYSLAQCNVYSNSFKNILKNSFLMGLMRFPKHLLLLLLHPGLLVVGYFALNFIPACGPIISYVWLFLFVLFGSIGILAWMLFILTSFDMFVNKDNYPEYVRKGLYTEKKED